MLDPLSVNIEAAANFLGKIGSQADNLIHLGGFLASLHDDIIEEAKNTLIAFLCCCAHGFTSDHGVGSVALGSAFAAGG